MNSNDLSHVHRLFAIPWHLFDLSPTFHRIVMREPPIDYALVSIFRFFVWHVLIYSTCQQMNMKYVEPVHANEIFLF